MSEPPKEFERELGSGHLVVKQERLPNGRWISTVFLDAGLGPEGEPYETMVYASEFGVIEIECRHYFTEAEARAGHAELAAKHGFTAKGTVTVRSVSSLIRDTPAMAHEYTGRVRELLEQILKVAKGGSK